MPDHPIPEHVEAITLRDGRTFRRKYPTPDSPWCCHLDDVPTPPLVSTLTIDIDSLQMRVNLLECAGLDIDRAMALARELEGVA